jgi:hypothetical protein
VSPPPAARVGRVPGALRRLLLRSVFAPPVERSPRRRLGFVVAVVVAVGAGVLQLVRQPGSALDSPWAEDGRIFLTDAWAHPFLHEILAPYAGYDAVYPRLVSALAAHLAVGDAAAVMALGGALATAVGVGLVVAGTEGHVESVILRGLLGAGVAAFPVAGIEVAAATCNAQWWLMAASFTCLLWRPRTIAGELLPAAALFLAASNDPIVGVLLPLALLRWIALPTVRDNVPGLALVVGLVGQLPSLVHPTLQAATTKPSVGELIHAWLYRVPEQAVLGPQLPAHLGIAGGVLAGLVVVAALGCAVAGGGRRGWVAIGAVVATLPLFAVPVYLRWSSVYLDKRIATGGTRYSLAPIALCLTAIVLGLDALRTRHRGATITLTVALSVLLTVCAITGGSATHTRTPSWSAQLPAARTACRAAGGSGVTALTVSPTFTWRALVPCRVLSSGPQRA